MPKQTKISINPAEPIDKIKVRLAQIKSESDVFIQGTLKPIWDYNQNLYVGETEVDANLPAWKSTLFLNLTFGVVNSDISGSLSSLVTPNDFYTIYPYRASLKKGLFGPKIDLKKSALVLEKIMKIQENSSRFYTELYYAVKDSSIKSVGIIKVDWVQKDKPKRYLDQKDGKIVEVTKEYKVKSPRFQNIAPEDFIIHPKAKNVDDSPYAGNYYLEYTSNIEDNPYYNVDEQVTEFMDTYKDREIPEQVRLAEIWDNKNQVHVITETGHVIKSHVTPYKHNLKPYAICVKNPLQRQWYGISTVDAYSDIQNLMNATTNDLVDGTRMSLFRSFLVGSGFESKTPITMRPGAMYTVKNIEQFKEFGVSPPPPDIYRFFEQFDSFTNRIIGNLDQGDTTGINTATEARLVYSRAAGTFKEFSTFNRENFLRRILQLWIELNQQFLTVEDIQGLVPEDELNKIEFEPKNVDITAPFGFWVTGEKNLEDRQTQLDKIQVFGNLMGIMQAMPPQIDQDKLVARIVKSLDMGDDILKPIEAPPVDTKTTDPKAGPSVAKQEQIGKDLAVLAQKQGMAPDALMVQLAQKLGATPEDVLMKMVEVGSVNGFLQQVAQQLASPPDIPAQPGAPELGGK